MAPQVNAPKYTINEVWKAHKHLPNFAEVDGAAKDTFVNLPDKYLDDFRNPCWCVWVPISGEDSGQGHDILLSMESVHLLVKGEGRAPFQKERQWACPL